MTYSLVLPYHHDIARLVPTVVRARSEGPAVGVREILLCHNGPNLSSEMQATVDAMEMESSSSSNDAKNNDVTVRSLHTDAEGIGAGYRLGIREAREPYVILSADDLPFGWTDVEGFEAAGRPDFAIGSKAHPYSRLAGIKGSRRLSTFLFRSLRRMLLGWETPGDSQGSLILRTEIAKNLEPDLVYDHYLCSLELATLHLKRGGKIIEVPITYETSGTKSSVSVVRDGVRMARELVELRGRMRSETR